MKRNSTTNQFDVSFASDTKGDVFVSSLANGNNYSFKGRKFLHVGDRIVEVQNTCVQDMEDKSTDAIQKLLNGCDLATIRVRYLKR